MFITIDEKVQLPNGVTLTIRSWAIGPFFRHITIECEDVNGKSTVYRDGSGVTTGCVFHGGGEFTVNNAAESDVKFDWTMGFPWWLSHMNVSYNGKLLWKWAGHPFGRAHSEYVSDGAVPDGAVIQPSEVN